MALLRWHAGRQGVVLHVSSLGKAKTGLQMSAIVMLMLVARRRRAVGHGGAAGRRGAHGRLRPAVPARRSRAGRAMLRSQLTSSKSPGSSRLVCSRYSRM